MSEATVDSMTNKTQTIARRRHSRLSLNWIDFLVIAAIILTFTAIVSTTLGRAKASTYNSALSSPRFSSEVSQIPEDRGLIKARIRLAVGGPWT
jgi:hypothetical protein